jgi:transcriptional regulator with XRE-family HTH domain
MIDSVGRRRTPGFAQDRIREARVAKGWTQGRLAAEADVSLRTITAWERGLRAPEPPTLVMLARVLDIEPHELLVIPADQWTLIELRTATGLLQQSAAKAVSVTPDRLSHLESGYERLDDRTRAALAAVYHVSDEMVQDSWQRGRDQLRARD